MRRTALCFWLTASSAAVPGIARPIDAQQLTGIAAVDSASVARAAWTSAVRASQARDTRSARVAVERAAAAWPTQQTYVWSRVVLAAALDDTAAVERGLLAYAALGLGRPLSDTVFDRYRGLAWFSAVRDRHEANRAPMARSRVARALGDSTLWPEGVDVDPRSGTFYVTSVRHGTVIEARLDGRERVVWPHDGASIGAALAVRVDPRGDRLWVTTSAIPQWARYTRQDSTSTLLEIRIADGVVLRRWTLTPGDHVLGDVAIGPNGDVYVSDSGEPVLYRLRRGADSLETHRDPLFRSLQGVAPAAKGIVYVADYSHGILRVDLESKRVERLADAPRSTSLGVDGLAWSDGALIAIQNGVSPARVMRFELDRSGRRIVAADVLDRRPDADEPTIGTVVGNEFVYVANSQWSKFTSDGGLRAGASLARPMIFAVPLARPQASGGR